MTSAADPPWPDDRSSADELARRIVAAGVTREVDEARVVTDGMQHVVLVIDDRLVARFARNPAAADALRREATLLGSMGATVTTPVPTPVHVDERFTVHRMLHGDVTTRNAVSRLPASARNRLVDEMGRFLVELASLATDGLDPSEATTSAARFRSLRERADGVVLPLLWAHQRRWYDELFDAVERVSFDHRPSLIHGDLAPYHVLHDPGTGELTGVLDFGVAGVGDPAVDLACLISTWGEGLAAGLVRTWPLAGDLVDRARLVAAALPLEWATIALEGDAADMAVAHLGHVATDIGPFGSPFG